MKYKQSVKSYDPSICFYSLVENRTTKKKSTFGISFSFYKLHLTLGLKLKQVVPKIRYHQILTTILIKILSHTCLFQRMYSQSRRYIVHSVMHQIICKILHIIWCMIP